MERDSLPKVELHCHLDGILDPKMVQEICRDDPTFPVHPEEFQKAYPVSDIESFFGWWQAIQSIEGELAYFYPILERHIERLKAQNVRYSEIMIAAGELPKDQAEAVEGLGAFRDWVNGREDGDIQIEFLVAIGRQRPPENMASLGGLVLSLYEAGLVVGVALAGPEICNPVKPFQSTFARLHEAGMGIEIHAGEWCGPESIWDALAHGYPDRIGHGVSLFQDPRLVDTFQERQLHFELCPTSNLKTGSISRMEDHPVRQALDLGLNFSVNTDDPGVFECSMGSEYEILKSVFDFDESDLLRVYTNSLEARFQADLRVRP